MIYSLPSCLCLTREVRYWHFRLIALVLALVLASTGYAGESPAGDYVGLQPGLGGLPFLGQSRTRSISAENPTGEKGKGGMATPDPSDPKPAYAAHLGVKLGQGWKIRPFLRVNAKKTATLMDITGSGIIQHIWFAEYQTLNRSLVIRCYWDDETQPSVEVPVSEFFAVGHGRVGLINSLAIMVNPKNALSCFWPMPFHKRARITITNEGDGDQTLVAYQITYTETKIPATAATFHAQYRQARTSEQNPYVILDGVQGHGRYVGTFLAWTQMEKG